MGDNMYLEDLGPVEDDDGANQDGADSYKTPEMGEDFDVTADGGVKKTILVFGEGYNTPAKGDEVTVHYVGTLASDGSKFDSSRDRADPFVFTVGVGQVIKGWDEGVLTMRKGEKSILTCTAEYGYGAGGSPPKIPGGATLKFEVELISWKNVADLTNGHNGIIKRQVAAGGGWRRVQDRDTPRVRYAARVEGAEDPFEQSPEDGVEFLLTEGVFCPAIATAVRTMQKGEKVELTVLPEWGLGAATVPPGATIVIDLELLGWKRVEDVIDGSVVKTVMNDPVGYEKPNECSQVSVRVTGRLADGTVFWSAGGAEGGELAAWTTDRFEVAEGLDAAVMSMVKGEVADVEVQPGQGYGDAGAQQEGWAAAVPPGAVLNFELELVDFTRDKENYEMNNTEKLAAANHKREEGNGFFKSGKTAKALSRYDKAISHIEHDSGFNEEEKEKGKATRLSLYSNKAACHLALKQWKEAISASGKALEIESSSVKALFRRAKALRETEEFEAALVDLGAVLEKEPDNRSAQVEQANVKKLIARQNKKDKKMYSQMFSKMSKMEALPGDLPPPPSANKAEDDDIEPFNPETMVKRVPK